MILLQMRLSRSNILLTGPGPHPASLWKIHTQKEAARVETKMKKTRANAGETLVEVMASVFIFLIMMGIMEAAISYSNASLAKNKEIRANNAAVLEQLATASVEDGDTKDITFRAANSDISQLGKQLFTVKTKLQKKTVTYTDTNGREQTVTFYQYGTSRTGTGGADPDTPDPSGGGGS